MTSDHEAPARAEERLGYSPGHDPVEWVEARIQLRQSDSAESLYDDMESQSGRQLPVIYQPFDGMRRGHFVDQGSILDYAVTTNGGRVLDFGPGDGWPSLRIAPFVDEVIGVDASARRVEVCRGNARRLGIDNARFVHVPLAQPLPFEEDCFDSVTAASSIEQTPDPEATLRELCRVLKPGGRLRMNYESLGRYRGGQERGVHFDTNLVIFDRYVDDEYVRHYLLRLDGSPTQLPRRPSCADLTEPVLEALLPAVQVVTAMRAPAEALPGEWDPMIVAVK